MAHKMQGTWQSYLSSRDGDETLLEKDGLLIIDEIDPLTGQVKGKYEDLDSKRAKLEGSITYVGSYSYAVVIEHEIPESTNSRHYEGSLVAEVGEDSRSITKLVGGTYYDFPTIEPILVPRTDPASALVADAQEQGTWVGTQP